jgi:hypothetical protein
VDREHVPGAARQAAAQGGEHQPVGGAPGAAPTGAARHARLVPQRQELDVGDREVTTANQQAKQRADGSVDDSEQHAGDPLGAR